MIDKEGEIADSTFQRLNYDEKISSSSAVRREADRIAVLE